MQSKAPARRRRRSHHFGGEIRHGRRTARSNRCATRRCPTLKTCRRERRGLAAACDRRARCRDATRRCGGGGGCRCSHACSAGRRRERAQRGATSASSAWPSRRRASAPRTTRHAPLAPPLRSSGTRTTLATVCRPIARDVNRTDADRVRAPPALHFSPRRIEYKTNRERRELCAPYLSGEEPATRRVEKPVAVAAFDVFDE